LGQLPLEKLDGFELWCLTPLSTISQLYRGCEFYCWGEPEYPDETIDLSQVTDKLYNKMFYRVDIAMSGIRPHNVRGDRYLLQIQLLYHYEHDVEKIENNKYTVIRKSIGNTTVNRKM